MDKITAARAAVNAETFGADAWEAAMATVRTLVASQPATKSLNVVLVPASRRSYRAVAA